MIPDKVENIKGCLGCEIEGLIKTTDLRKLKLITSKQEGWVLGGDGSIHNSLGDGYTTFELKVGIYKIEDKPKMLNDLKKVFELIKVNTSCGLHIHVSFKHMSDYYKLLNWGWVNSFQNSYNNIFTSATEQARKNGGYSSFYHDESQFNNIVEQQLKYYHKTARYFSVNFNAFNLYKTIEFRIFPATDNLNKFTEYLNFLLGEIRKGLNLENDFKKYDIEVKEKNKTHAGPVIIKEVIEVEVEVKK